MVFPGSNAAFLLLILLLFGMWSALGLVRGTANFAMMPTLLLFGFLVAAWLAGFASVQYHATQVALTIWCGHVMVFVLASSLRSGTAMGVVLAFVVVTSTAEAIFSIVHLQYSLPQTRLYVKNDPVGAARLFRAELNPALVHRLESNRAFGTLLFANALASWMVASIPLALFGLWYALRRFKSATEATLPKFAHGMVVGVVAAAVSIPVLSAAPTLTAMANIPFSDVVVGVPFSPALMRLPVAGMVVVFIQIVVIGIAFGVFAVLSMLFKSGSKREEQATAHSMIAGVLTAAVLCISLAVLYSQFHYFYFADTIMSGGQMQIVRASLYEPIIPFLFFVLVIPVSGAAVAIRVTRRHGASSATWLALSALFFVAALSQIVSVCLTYSRGGMLALIIAGIVTILLFRSRNSSRETVAKLKTAAAGLLFVFAASTLLHHSDAQAQTPAGEPASNRLAAEIDIEGTDMTFSDLANPKTVTLRFTYWAGAFDMAVDNWMTGVGLGNFGVAYPQHQPPGDSDTKQVHNDFLQLLCETGIVAFIFFCGFWTWFVVIGGVRLRAIARSESGWLIAGLYGCVVGFVLHAIVDFPFINPSLATLVFLLAGLFWAQVQADQPDTKKPFMPVRVVMAAGLVFTFAVFGLSVRLGHVGAAIGTQDVRQDRIRTASQLVREIEAPANTPLTIPDSVIARLVEDPATRKAFGSHFYHPRPADPAWAPLPPGAPIPRDAQLMLTNMPLIMSKAKEASAHWTTRIAEADAVHPYNPEIAFHLSIWFDMLWRSGDSPEDGLPYIKQAVQWADRAVERSPRQVAFYDWLFLVRWRQALSEPEVEDQITYYNLSLEAIDRTVELYPIKPYLWDKHALVYLWAGQSFEYREQTVRAEECFAISLKSQEEALAIRTAQARDETDEES